MEPNYCKNVGYNRYRSRRPPYGIPPFFGPHLRDPRMWEPGGNTGGRACLTWRPKPKPGREWAQAWAEPGYHPIG